MRGVLLLKRSEGQCETREMGGKCYPNVEGCVLQMQVAKLRQKLVLAVFE
jgi:hypothetical protein